MSEKLNKMLTLKPMRIQTTPAPEYSRRANTGYIRGTVPVVDLAVEDLMDMCELCTWVLKADWLFHLKYIHRMCRRHERLIEK